MMRIKSLPHFCWPLALGLLIVLGWPISHALAADVDHLASLTIQVWPEYDDPRVLVQYDGQVSSQNSLPRDISFYVPTGAAINATAYVDSNSQFINTDPAKTQDVGDGFSLVTFNLPTDKFHLEFYYNPLQGSPDKTMEFVYKARQPADQVQLDIQEPLKADNFTTVPTSTVQTTKTHNFKYHVFTYSNVVSDQSLKVQIGYTKTDPNPSIANVTSPQPVTPEPASSIPWIPVGLVGSGVGIAGLGFLAWRSRRNSTFVEQSPFTSTHSRRRAKHNSAFCAQCGHGLTAEDNFCPRCGTKKRAQ